MSKPTIAERTQALVAKHLGAELASVTPDADLTGQLGADSLDVVEICIAAEEEFSCNITDDNMDGWQTVADVIATVEKATS